MKGTTCCKNDGISLRDYFAGQIVAGACLSPGYLGRDAALAEYCFSVADAMLKAREKKEN